MPAQVITQPHRVMVVSIPPLFYPHPYANTTDFFFGFGKAAQENAGRMKQRGMLWVLLPKQTPPATAAGTPAQ